MSALCANITFLGRPSLTALRKSSAFFLLRPTSPSPVSLSPYVFLIFLIHSDTHTRVHTHNIYRHTHVYKFTARNVSSLENRFHEDWDFFSVLFISVSPALKTQSWYLVLFAE